MQLLFCRVLLPVFVQNSTQYAYVVLIKLSPGFSLKFKWCNYTKFLTWLQLGRKD